MRFFLIQFLLICFIIYTSNFLFQVYEDTCNTYDFSKCEKNYCFDYLLFDNIKDKLKSGDILLFCAYDHYGVARLKKNIIFQHYAVVVKIKGELYCLECTTNIIIKKGCKYKTYGRGIYLTKLEDRLLTYSGNILYASIAPELSNENEKKLQHFAKESVTNPNYKYLSDFNVYLNMYHGVDYDYKNQYTCISFVNYIFRYVINYLEDYEYVKPSELCKFYHKLILEDENIWSWPVELIHSDLYIDTI